MIRNLILLFAVGTILIGFIAPGLSVLSGVEDEIYLDFRGFGPPVAILCSALLLLGATFAIFPAREIIRHKALPETNSLQLLICGAVIVGWTAIFLAFGGLSYRVDDVFAGTAGRNPILVAAQALTNVIIVLSVSTLSLTNARMPLKLLLWAISLGFVGAIAASGSRGVILTWMIALFFARLLRKPFVHAGGMQDGTNFVAPNLLREVTRPLVIAAIALILLAFGVWGAMRDQYSDVGYSFLWRIAEPYWYMAANTNADVGDRTYILGEALWRIITIPARWFGYAPNFSIEGQEYILENYLGIPIVDGISLPISLIGEGYLFYGAVGAAFFLFLGAILIISAFRIIERLPFASRQVYWAFLGVFLAKVTFSYARSLSGVFLVTWYEPLRDFCLLTVLLFLWRSRPVSAAGSRASAR